jgi:hypothetical protein
MILFYGYLISAVVQCIINVHPAFVSSTIIELGLIMAKLTWQFKKLITPGIRYRGLTVLYGAPFIGKMSH